MRVRGPRVRSWLAGLGLLFAAPLAAQTLGLGDVLQSSRRHAPQVLEALARVDVAAGRRLEAEGAFDTQLAAEGSARPAGYYDGREVGLLVTRPLASRGGQVYGGYRVSGGSFPIYENELYTNRAGELKVGAVIALLRDRAIDERRFGLFRADTDMAIAETEALLVAIGVQRRAVEAYLAWVAAGQRLAVYRQLLALAEERQAGFRRQVRSGARPPILLTENEQIILRRQSLVVDSERILEASAVRLSLFWRGEDGRPRMPAAALLPAQLPQPLPLSPDGRARIQARPDLKLIDLRIAQASERLRLDDNAMRPRLDVLAEASQDLGQPGEGGPTFSGTVAKLGFVFSVPFEQRAARGRIAATRADIRAFELRRRQLEEDIGAALDALDIDVRTSRRLLDLAAQERARALELARAEQRRFELGASDLFLTTVREETAADAEVRAIDAALRQAVAHADVAAATADVSVLGLDPGEPAPRRQP